MINVVVKETNEVLGFPDTMSKEDIEGAIRGDLYGEVKAPKPNFYRDTIQPALESSGMDMFQPSFATTFVKEKDPDASMAFVTSYAKGASMGFIDTTSDRTVRESLDQHPIASFTGQLAGEVQALIATAGFGASIGLAKASTAVGVKTMQSLGSGPLAKVAGKTTSAALRSAGVGALYGAIKGSKIAFDDYVDTGKASSVIKVGEEALKDAGAFALFGAAGAPFRSVAIGSSAVGGTAYLLAKAEGASEEDALLSAGVMAIFHAVSTPRLKKPQEDTAELNEYNAVALKAIENMKAGYIKAKNPVINTPLAIRTAQEHTMSVIENKQALAASEPKQGDIYESKEFQEAKKIAGDLETADLEGYIESRYEAGAGQTELDVLETLYAERISEESPGFLDEMENVLDADQVGWASLEEVLIRSYHNLISGDAEKSGMSKEDVLTNMRANIEEAMFESGQKDVKDAITKITDEQIMDAAKDVYEAKVELLKRIKSEKILTGEIEPAQGRTLTLEESIAAQVEDILGIEIDKQPSQASQTDEQKLYTYLTTHDASGTGKLVVEEGPGLGGGGKVVDKTRSGYFAWLRYPDVNVPMDSAIAILERVTSGKKLVRTQPEQFKRLMEGARKHASGLFNTADDIVSRKRKESPSAGEGLGSRGSKSVYEFEKRVSQNPPPKDSKYFKMFEETRALARKYALRFGEGWQPKGLLGVFYPKSKNIFLNSLNNLSTLVHEVVHFVDDKHGTIKKIMEVVGYTSNGRPKYNQAHRKESKELTEAYTKYYPGASSDHKKELRMTEGLAVFIQRMVEQPTITTAEFPALVKAYLDPSGKFFDQTYVDLIQDAGDIVSRFQALDPLEQIGATINRKRFDTDKKIMSLGDRITQEIFDSVRPVELLAETAGVKGSTEDPSLFVRAFKNIGSMLQNNIHPGSGYITFRSGEFLKLYKENWGDLVRDLKKRNISERFDSWLVARRAHFDYLQLDAMKDELKKLEEDAAFAAELAQEAAEEAEDNEIGEYEKSDASDYIDRLKKDISRLESILRNDNVPRDRATRGYESEKESFRTEAKLFDKLVRADLEFLASQEVQLVKPEAYEKMIQNQGYSTKMRETYNEILGDENLFSSTGRKSGPAALRSRVGSDRIVTSPIQSSIRNHAQALKKGTQQIIYNKLVRLADSIPDLFQPTNLVRAVDSKTGRIFYPQDNDKETIMGRRNYKRYPVKVNAEVKKIVDDLISPQNYGAVEKALVVANRVFTKGTTGFYLPFLFKNWTIDQFTATAQSKNKYMPIVDQVAILRSKILKGDNSREAKYFEEYLMLGGARHTIHNWMDMSADEFIEALEHEESALRKVIGLAENVADVFAAPVQASELITRGAEFVKARMAGKNQLAALEEAGRVSGPFHHIGRLGDSAVMRTLIRSIPYMNSGLQILGQATASVKDPETRKRYMFIAAIISAAMLGGLLAIYAKASDEQKRLYRSLQTYDLSNNIIYPHPTDNTKLVKIPVSAEFATVASIVNAIISDYVLDTNYSAEEYIRLATSLIPDQINITNISRMIMSWIPKLISPEIEVITNTKSFPTPGPIESMGDKSLPPRYRTRENTALYARWLGKQLNLSPIKIEHLIEGRLGRTVRIIDSAIGMATGQKSKQVQNPYELEMYLSATRQIDKYYRIKTVIAQEESADRKMLGEMSEETKDLIAETKPTIKKVDALMKRYRSIKDNELMSQEVIKIRTEILDLLDTLP